MNQKKKFSLGILIFMIFLLGIQGYYNPKGFVKEGTIEPNDIKSSYPYQWTVSHEVVIDEEQRMWNSITWDQAVSTYPWASGAGTESDPYKIQDVLFTGLGVHAG